MWAQYLFLDKKKCRKIYRWNNNNFNKDIFIYAIYIFLCVYVCVLLAIFKNVIFVNTIFFFYVILIFLLFF